MCFKVIMITMLIKKYRDPAYGLGTEVLSEKFWKLKEEKEPALHRDKGKS